MPINFFLNTCKSNSSSSEFGICDDTPPPASPAYLNENDRTKWVAIVKNPDHKTANFYAIDNCINILRPDGNQESRCDGLLQVEKDLIFVELKSRESSGWFKKGREQLTTTINLFKANNEMNNFNSIQAYVCNDQKPRSNVGRAASIQQFKNDTGYILRDMQEILI